MSKCEDLLEVAKRNRRGVRFSKLVQLAECFGFVTRRRTATSHLIMTRSGFARHMNFQPDRNGMAKAEQVRQLLDAIEEIAES
jgi:hypothetical protein